MWTLGHKAENQDTFAQFVGDLALLHTVKAVIIFHGSGNKNALDTCAKWIPHAPIHLTIKQEILTPLFRWEDASSCPIFWGRKQSWIRGGERQSKWRSYDNMWLPFCNHIHYEGKKAILLSTKIAWEQTGRHSWLKMYLSGLNLATIQRSSEKIGNEMQKKKK